jgi:hypothetical protein
MFNRRVVGHHQLTMVLELVNVFGVGIGFAAFELELLFLTPSISPSRWFAKDDWWGDLIWVRLFLWSKKHSWGSSCSLTCSAFWAKFTHH